LLILSLFNWRLFHIYKLTMTHRCLIFSFLLFFNLRSVSSQNADLYFPPNIGANWQSLTPASQQFCPDRIDSLYHFLEERHTKSFMLLKDGKIILEKYFGTFVPDSVWYWASAGKSLTAFLVGQAQEDGLLDIQDKTSNYLGVGWTSAPPEKEALITLRHQLTMTSGLDDAFEPTPPQPDPNYCTAPACLQYLADAGTRWAYHTGPYRLLQDVIAGASGQTINQFTKSHILDRTGMKGLWFQDVFYSKTRDMARFGLLILAKGVWDGDTLLHDDAYFQAMTHVSQNINKGYGYLWWLNGQPNFMLPGLQWTIPGSLIPNAPHDLVAALGKNDQKIHVVPSKGWVVVRMGDDAGVGGTGGNDVPILFDNALWGYLNQLVCNTTVSVEREVDQLKIAPNPGSAGWQVACMEAINQVEIVNMQGVILRKVTGNQVGSLWIDGQGLPEGMLTLRVGTAGKVYRTKVLKVN
jgi:CubicO group peptidase (beta-lactamase class C family)